MIFSPNPTLKTILQRYSHKLDLLKFQTGVPQKYLEKPELRQSVDPDQFEYRWWENHTFLKTGGFHTPIHQSEAGL